MEDFQAEQHSSLLIIYWEKVEKEMKIFTFAAAYIGSYEVSLKIYEISPKRGIREIDYIRARVELGKDAYSTGNIGYELVEALCNTLADYKKIMNTYQVDAYEVYAASVLRDTGNLLFILDQIRIRTGLKVRVLSNSEHRFISYKAIAVQEEFEKLTQKGAAFVEVGGGSMQVTVFAKGKAVTTQHLALGTMKIREQLERRCINEKQYEKQIEELVYKELEMFKSLYMENVKIKYLIIVGDFTSELVHKMGKSLDDETIEAIKVASYLKGVSEKSAEEIAIELNLPVEYNVLLIPYMMVLKCMANGIGAERIWAPRANFNDGMAYDYAWKNQMLKSGHDFDADIIAAAKGLSERYLSFTPHIDALVQMSNLIFDTMKKVHGLGRRERLLMNVSAILHDCGKFISIANAPQCSYDIIMASEIIGLSHKERTIIANVVLHKSRILPSYEYMPGQLDHESYLIIAKLSAIIQVANAMDRSHKQKFKNVKASIKGRELVITIETEGDSSLEKALFDTKTAYFEHIFSMKPVIKEKRVHL